MRRGWARHSSLPNTSFFTAMSSNTAATISRNGEIGQMVLPLNRPRAFCLPPRQRAATDRNGINFLDRRQPALQCLGASPQAMSPRSRHGKSHGDAAPIVPGGR